PGAIGRRPTLLGPRFPIALVKLAPDNQVPLRTPAGFCVQCDAHEVGEAIGRISTDRNNPQRFDGYADQVDTERKIIRDVFSRGDAWFRTGDMMYADQQGYFYFVDRIGDTFRWKGE